MFNQDELKALQGVLSRVTIQGNEALTLVLLQQKVQGLLENKPVDKKKDPLEAEVVS